MSLQILNEKIMESNINDLQLIVNIVDQQLLSVVEICNAMFSNPDIYALNVRPSEGVLDLFEYRRLLFQLNLITASTPIDSDITVVLINKMISLSSRYGMSHLTQEDIESIFHENSTLFPMWSIIENNKGTKLLTYTLTSFIGSEGIAIKSSVTIDGLMTTIDRMAPQNSIGVFLISPNDNMVFTGSPAIIEESELLSIVRESSVGEYVIYGAADGDFSNEEMRLLVQKLSLSGFYIAICYSENDITDQIDRVQVFIIISVGLVLLLFAVVIYTSYRSLILSNEIYRKTSSEDKATLKFLQSQIKPHFLNNSLGFIYQMCVAGKAESAADMAIHLSDYFQYASKSNSDTALLSEELKSLEAYMKIQAMRFPERFSYSIDIEETLKYLIIPRLIVQPFVENAFIHGLQNMKDAGKLSIKGYIEDGVTFIIVKDNGVGMSETKYKNFQKQMQSDDRQDEMLGIENTNKRLKLFYGDKSSVTVSSIEGEGTTITIRIEVRHV